MTDKRQRGGQHVGGVGLVVHHHHAHGVVRPRAGWREIDLMGIHRKPLLGTWAGRGCAMRREKQG